MEGGRGAPISRAGSLTALIDEEAERAGIDPRIMEGIRRGESDRKAHYDVKNDSMESSWGPFQLNRRGGSGNDFERDTAAERKRLGLGDLRDPRTIPLQVRWVAEYIKKHLDKNPRWSPYPNWYKYGPQDADPRWGNSGYVPAKPEESQAPSVGRSVASGGLSLKPNMTRAKIDEWNEKHKNPLAPAFAPVQQKPSPYGSLDPEEIRRSFGIQQPNFKVPPLGHQSSWHRSTSNQVAMNQNTEIHVHGVDNPQEAAQRVGRHQTRVNSDLLKNTMGAIG